MKLQMHKTKTNGNRGTALEPSVGKPLPEELKQVLLSRNLTLNQLDIALITNICSVYIGVLYLNCKTSK